MIKIAWFVQPRLADIRCLHIVLLIKARNATNQILQKQNYFPFIQQNCAHKIYIYTQKHNRAKQRAGSRFFITHRMYIWLTNMTKTDKHKHKHTNITAAIILIWTIRVSILRAILYLFFSLIFCHILFLQQ